MSLSNPNKPVTEQRLQEFYHGIEPYMGGGGGTGGGGHTIEDSEGNDLEQRDTLQFGDGFNATDDSENEKTVVEPNLMTAADMDDVVTPLPSVQSRYHKYSTEEQIVGEWIDGKPIYEKTINFGSLPNKTSKNVPIGVDNIDKVVGGEAIAIDVNNAVFILPSSSSSDVKYNISIVVLLPSFDIQISTDFDRSSAVAYVTIRYTKTTS